MKEAIVASLLLIGILGFACSSLGLLLFRDTYQRIHFLAPASLMGAIAIPAAVLVQEGFSQIGLKAVLIAFLLSVANPVLSHATARAARIRRNHQWLPAEGDEVPLVEEPD